MKTETFLSNVRKDVPLSRYTTFGIGGNAKYFWETEKKEELIEGIKGAKNLGVPFFILGNGSNILVSDKGYDGLIIRISGGEIRLEGDTIICGSGVLLSSVVAFCLKKRLSGLEWAAGIPGMVGGAVRGNAGGFGSSMSEITSVVEVFNSRTGRIRKMKNKDCNFGYRESIFKSNSDLVITEVQMDMKKARKAAIEDEIKRCLDYRRKRQPRGLSAGSVFKNYHIKNKTEKEKLFQKFPEMAKVASKGTIPAGFLIEKCGLKGKILGKVMISRVHSNFIINLGKGKAADVKKLTLLTKNSVKEKFGISLEEEIELVGF